MIPIKRIYRIILFLTTCNIFYSQAMLVEVSVKLAEKKATLHLNHSQALALLSMIDDIYTQNRQAIVSLSARAAWDADRSCETHYNIDPLNQNRSVTFQNIERAVDRRGFKRFNYFSSIFTQFQISCSQQHAYEQILNCTKFLK